jgi:hypothetical protein
LTMIFLFFFGGLLILIGVAEQKEAYYSFDFMCIPVKEGKLNEHDAMWSGITIALIGVLLVRTPVFSVGTPWLRINRVIEFLLHIIHFQKDCFLHT